MASTPTAGPPRPGGPIAPNTADPFFGIAGPPPDRTVDQLGQGIWDQSVTPFGVSAPTISGVSYNPETIAPSSYSATTIDPSFYSPTSVSAPTESLFSLGPSSFESLTQDPTSRLAQIQMLADMQRAYSQGGFTDTERANIENVLLQQRQAQTAGAMGAFQEAQRRGLGTSSASLAASLFASQQVAQTASTQALQVAQMAEQSRTQLRGDISGLAGNIRSMDYKSASDRASAIDAVNKFNIDNKQQWAARAASQEMQARTFNASASNDANRFAAQQTQSAAGFNASAMNDQNRFNAQQSQSASAFNAGETNTANRFAAQTAFDASKSNADWALSAAEHNSSQSFAAEEYNHNQAFNVAQYRTGIDQYNNQQAFNTWQSVVGIEQWNYDHPGGLNGQGGNGAGGGGDNTHTTRPIGPSPVPGGVPAPGNVPSVPGGRPPMYTP